MASVGARVGARFGVGLGFVLGSGWVCDDGQYIYIYIEYTEWNCTRLVASWCCSQGYPNSWGVACNIGIWWRFYSRKRGGKIFSVADWTSAVDVMIKLR